MPLPKRDSDGRFIPKTSTKTPVKVLEDTRKYSYVLKVVNPNMSSQYARNFKYPSSGMVSAPDWRGTPGCGYGLHGWENGKGSRSVTNSSIVFGSKWLVLKVLASSIVQLSGKVKFPKGEVVFCGTRADAVNFIKTVTGVSPDISKTVESDECRIVNTEPFANIKSTMYKQVIVSDADGVEVTSINSNCVVVQQESCQDNSSSVSVGEDSIGIAYDRKTAMRGGKGSTLIWRVAVESSFKFKSVKIGKTVKANTWYQMGRDGKLYKVNP